MRVGELIMSDSLYNLIMSRCHESECLKVLASAIYDLRYGNPSLKLAPEFPGNYFTFRERSGLISYMPKGREQKINADGTWARKGRQSMKPARWIRMMLHPRLAAKFKDSNFAQFNAILLHEELKTQLTFNEVPIQAGYTRDAFVRIESCMWNHDVAPFYEAFRCKSLVATTPQHGTLYVGRALIWPNVQVNDDEDRITLLDRIYCGTEEVSMAFKEHASAMGWWRKRAQSADVGTFMKPNGEEAGVALTAFTDLENLDHISFYPYLDTLFYGGDNWLSSGDMRGHKWLYRNGTPGSKGTRTDASHSGQVLDYRGRWIDEYDAVRVGGVWYHEESDEIVMCARRREYILRRDAFRIDLPYGSEDTFYVHRSFVRRLG